MSVIRPKSQPRIPNVNKSSPHSVPPSGASSMAPSSGIAPPPSRPWWTPRAPISTDNLLHLIVNKHLGSVSDIDNNQDRKMWGKLNPFHTCCFTFKTVIFGRAKLIWMETASCRSSTQSLKIPLKLNSFAREKDSIFYNFLKFCVVYRSYFPFQLHEYRTTSFSALSSFSATPFLVRPPYTRIIRPY